MAKAKFTYTAIDMNGTAHTRNSNRVYTHAVLYQESRETCEQWARDMMAVDRKNAGYYLDIVKHGRAENLMEFPHYANNREAWARDVELAKGHLQGATTPEEYARRRFDETMAKHAAHDWSRWFCAGFCGRFDLAQRLADTELKRRRVANVQIVPVLVKG